MNATATKTIKLEFVTAPLIRCIARQDMPEAGIKEGSCFYLARSSKNDGTYYLLTWNFDRMKWDCSCPSYKPCKHEKAVNLDCHKSGHTLFSYKPATPCKGEALVAEKVAFINKVTRFQMLFDKYDYRQRPVEMVVQAPVVQAPVYTGSNGNYLWEKQVQAILNGQKVVAAPGAFCLAR